MKTDCNTCLLRNGCPWHRNFIECNDWEIDPKLLKEVK